ncbi:MBOAT family protein [Ignavibacteriales bacterium]
MGVGVANYYFGKILFSISDVDKRRFVLWGMVILNVGLLSYFKYTNFVLGQIASVQETEFSALDIILPVGISFYIFKVLSFLFDIYYEKYEELPRLDDFMLYVSFFGNIQAGPIDRADEFIPQIRENLLTSPEAKQTTGLAVFYLASGIIKKLIIADYISLNFITRVFEDPLRFTGVENLLAIYGFSVQIYFDFSGYSDMAVGMALLFGYKIIDNFNSPYKATSVADFWRRWHISLSRWLLDYLFTPMQMGLRTMKQYGNAIALVVTFAVCGLWHGATWGFIIWGTVHGIIMGWSVLTKKLRAKGLLKIGIKESKGLNFIRGVITFNIITVTWIFFKVDTLEKIPMIYTQLTENFHSVVFGQFYGGFPGVFIFFVIGLVIIFFPEGPKEKIKSGLMSLPVWAQGLILGLVIYLASQVMMAEMVPPIYFEF